MFCFFLVLKVSYLKLNRFGKIKIFIWSKEYFRFEMLEGGEFVCVYVFVVTCEFNFLMF